MSTFLKLYIYGPVTKYKHFTYVEGYTYNTCEKYSVLYSVLLICILTASWDSPLDCTVWRPNTHTHTHNFFPSVTH